MFLYICKKLKALWYFEPNSTWMEENILKKNMAWKNKVGILVLPEFEVGKLECCEWPKKD